MNKKLIRLTESDLHRIVKESVKRILNEIETIDGMPFEEWVETVKQTMKSRHCPYYKDNEFVRYIAHFCWQSVADNDANSLMDSLDGCFYEMDREYESFQKRY